MLITPKTKKQCLGVENHFLGNRKTKSKKKKPKTENQKVKKEKTKTKKAKSKRHLKTQKKAIPRNLTIKKIH